MREMEVNHLAQLLPWLINNVDFCYDGESPNNDKEKQNFLQHKENIKITKDTYTVGSKSKGRKVRFTMVFTDIIRRMNEMKLFKVALIEKTKDE